jgi:tetratricopeptide (TPR) repeat protein
VTSAERLADPTIHAHADRGLARAYLMLGRLDHADTHLHHALDLTTRTGDQVEQAKTHNYLAHLRQQQGHLTQALDHACHALDLHRAAGHQAGQAYALNTIGWCHAQLSNHRQALTACQQAVPLFQNLDHPDAHSLRTKLACAGGVSWPPSRVTLSSWLTTRTLPTASGTSCRTNRA